MRLRDLPSVGELLRDARLAAEPRTLAIAAAHAALDRAREEIRAGHDPGDLAERGRCGIVLAARHRPCGVPRGGGWYGSNDAEAGREDLRRTG